MSDCHCLNFNSGDVVWSLKLHLDTIRKKDKNESIYEVRGEERIYEVRGKERPALITGIPQTKKERCYEVLDFTSKTPAPYEYPDYLLGPEGKPQLFRTKLGFEKPSYLKIYPVQSRHEKFLTINAKVRQFSQIFLDHIVKEQSNRKLRVLGQETDGTK